MLLQKFSRTARGTIPQAIVDPSYWHDHLRRLWDDSGGPSGRNGVTKYWYLTFVPVLGLALAGVRWLRRALPPRRPLLLAWLACLGLAVLVELSAISFYSLGGNPHGRYLLPALSVLAVAGAAGMAGFPGPRALPTIVMLLAMVVVRSFRGHFSPEQHRGVEVPGIYWHFVDVMWIVVYSTVYLI